MPLSHQQLQTILARALPTDSLRDAKQVSVGRYAMQLASGEKLQVLEYATVELASTAAAALRLLKGEFDLPVPDIRAADAAGETVGTPYVLVSGAEGEPLTEVRKRIPEQQLYAIGQQLGETATRIHRLACSQFGALGAGVGATNERSYTLARLERGVAAAMATGLLNKVAAAEVREWFEREFQPVMAQPALIHSGLCAETLLVRKIDATWRLACITGWEQALGWVPAWEHATMRELTDPQLDFPLRVGYGNAYDERTKRTYEQVREPLLLPYNLLIQVEVLLSTFTRSEIALAEAARNRLLAMRRSQPMSNEEAE